LRREECLHSRLAVCVTRDSDRVPRTRKGHESCHVSGGGSVVLVDDAAESVAAPREELERPARRTQSFGARHAILNDLSMFRDGARPDLAKVTATWRSGGRVGVEPICRVLGVPVSTHQRATSRRAARTRSWSATSPNVRTWSLPLPGLHPRLLHPDDRGWQMAAPAHQSRARCARDGQRPPRRPSEGLIAHSDGGSSYDRPARRAGDPAVSRLEGRGLRQHDGRGPGRDLQERARRRWKGRSTSQPRRRGRGATLRGS
jgi:hypothetical protein